MAIILPQSTDVVKLNLSVGSLDTVLVDDVPHVVLRPAVESLGLSYSRQLKKLKTRSWACVAQRATQMPGDDQRRNMDVVTERTFLMWLATVNELRVAKHVRDALVSYQNETADAIAAYWLNGGVINPRATAQQSADLQRQIQELAPDAHAWQTLASGNSNYSIRTMAHILNQDPSITTGQNRLFRLFREWKWIDRKGKPYTREKPYLVKLPYGEYMDALTGEVRSGGAQVRATPHGLAVTHRRLLGTATVDECLALAVVV